MSRFRNAVGVAVVTLLGLASSSQAKAPEYSGIYDVEFSPRGGDNRRCVETWHLNPDGQFVIYSGEERVDGNWRVTGTGMRLRLERTNRRTNGLPDCLGQIAKSPLRDTSISFYRNNQGDLVLTTPTSSSDSLPEMIGFADKREP